MGTVKVKQINPGENACIGNLTNAEGVLYFTACDGVSGVELWKSDGTTERTAMVKDIVPGSNSSSPTKLTKVDDVLFFSADDHINGFGLWRLTLPTLSRRCGDSNADDVIDIRDAILTLKIAANIVQPVGDQAVLADLDRDGAITVSDAITLLRYIVRKIPALETCGPLE